MTNRFSPAIRRLPLWLLALSLFSCLLAAGRADAQASLSSSPETVTLTPGGSDRLVVSLKGVGKGGATFKVDSPSSVHASAAPLRGAGGLVRQWIVTLTADTSFGEDGTAILISQVGRQIITGTLPVKLRQAPAAAAQLSVALSFEGETLLDGLTRPLLAQVSNLADSPVRITLSPRLPSFVVTADDKWKNALLVPARSTVVVEIPIRTGTSPGAPLLSGKHEVAVIVRAERGSATGWNGQVVAATSLNVGVPGMSEVQGLLQVPSFLLFPGFLLVTSFMLTLRFRRKGWAAAEDEKGGLAVSWSSGLWLIAITLSILIIPCYPLLSWMTGSGWRNILYGFDLGDVIRVWFLSIVGGLLSALVVHAYQTKKEREEVLSTFSEDLTPVSFLERLALLGRSAAIPFMTLDDETDFRVYNLGGSLPDGKTWACSAIELSILEAGASGFDRRQLAEVLNRNNPGEIGSYLTEMQGIRAIGLKWQQAGSITGVAKVDAGRFTNLETARSVVVRG